MDSAAEMIIELPKIYAVDPSNAPGSGIHLEPRMPAIRTGTATTAPARGPATPMSKRARLSVIGARIRMNAPKVPKSIPGGEGRK